MQEPEMIAVPLQFLDGKPDAVFAAVNNIAAKYSERSLQLRCQLGLACEKPINRRFFECLIDTGASVTVVPYQIWKQWPKSCIIWYEPTNNKAIKASSITGATGHSVPAKVGQVEILLKGKKSAKGTTEVNSPTLSIFAKFFVEPTPEPKQADNQEFAAPPSDQANQNAPRKSPKPRDDFIILGMAGGAMECSSRLEVDFSPIERSANLVFFDC